MPWRRQRSFLRDRRRSVAEAGVHSVQPLPSPRHSDDSELAGSTNRVSPRPPAAAPDHSVMPPCSSSLSSPCCGEVADRIISELSRGLNFSFFTHIVRCFFLWRQNRRI